MRTALVLALLSSLALAACGGEEGGGDLTGEVAVPEGYARYSGSGISFVHPSGWNVDERTDAKGVPSVEVTDPNASATPGPLIRLTVNPGAGARFDSLVEQRRVVVEQANGGEVESEEEVALAGAKKALRTSTRTPAKTGTDPVEVTSAALDVLRENGDVVVFTAATPQRDGSSLDQEAVVGSFRFAEST